MQANLIKSVSMQKYERLLPRLFPASGLLEIRDAQNGLVWRMPSAVAELSHSADKDREGPDVGWSSLASGVERREAADGECWFRTEIGSN